MANTPRKKKLSKKDITEKKILKLSAKATPEDRKRFVRIAEWKLGIPVKLTAKDRKMIRSFGMTRKPQEYSANSLIIDSVAF